MQKVRVAQASMNFYFYSTAIKCLRHKGFFNFSDILTTHQIARSVTVWLLPQSKERRRNDGRTPNSNAYRRKDGLKPCREI
jgi:hypothetical protein